MQFGRMMGVGLLVVGMLLLVFQGIIFLSSPSVNPSPSTPPAQQSKTSSLPGIVGLAALAVGAVLFLTGRRQDEPEPKHAVK